jgi:hypothetical protein
MSTICAGERHLRRVGQLARLVAIAACAIAINHAGYGLAAEPTGDNVARDVEQSFRRPPAAARPWVFWYWVDAAASPEGITADLEAMKSAGFGGAYLMPIKGPTTPPRIAPPPVQLSAEYWNLVRHAAREADRLGLQLAMHVCDGFATAGGPWITPEQSMQQVVWSTTRIEASPGERVEAVLPQPETNEGFYRDIAVLAFPTPAGAGISSRTATPRVTTSEAGFDGAFLAAGVATPPAEGSRFRCDRPGWFEYEFDEPFTARSLTVWPEGTNYSALRLKVEASDDGTSYRTVKQLEPPRHGWQNTEAPFTYALPATTARRFRFVFDPAGSEPGAEDLDFAKWKPVLKIRGLALSSEARIEQFEGKSGAAWRVAAPTSAVAAAAEANVPRDQIVDLTSFMDADGKLAWDAPPGPWTIMRWGHTSTGKRNETAGGGQGLECDKLSAAAARRQYDRWFGETRRHIGPELAGRVLTGFHVDSWECGAQNWTAEFAAEFRARRGYDPRPWLPALAGVPVDGAAASERFLHDLRTTIAELMVEKFYGTLAELAHADGCWFSAECTAPTFPADGMAHFAKVDVPMGEFWLRSPTHDKPNDMLDAISAARVYGKPIVQAEAFTELRLAWDEHPGLLKAVGDRQFALGANRLVAHVWVENPWLDRTPGMTLSGIGVYFNRDQTWMPMARAWTDYLARCQALLQFGRPVVDVAVFTGEEIPRRSVHPERLVDALPGVIGESAVARERKRLANDGQPQEESPPGVSHSAISTLAAWADPLRGFAYDSINPDALVRLATVRDGRLELPGGPSYRVLVLPGKTKMDPTGNRVSKAVAAKVREAAAGGVAIIAPAAPDGLRGERVWAYPANEHTFHDFGLAPDFAAADRDNAPVDDVAWTHRAADGVDVYFLSNQANSERSMLISLRTAGRAPELWDPVTGDMREAADWKRRDDRTAFPVTLPPHGSAFVVFRKPTNESAARRGAAPTDAPRTPLNGPWRIDFASAAKPRVDGTPTAVDWERLFDWSTRDDDAVRYFAGIATYDTTFAWDGAEDGRRVWLDLGRVANLAEVTLNGRPCGVAWTPPYRVDVTAALKPGDNNLQIAVANCWHNRLVGDERLPPDQRRTWSTAPFPRRDAKLLEGGMLGPVELVTEGVE